MSKKIESQLDPENDAKEKVLGSENINDWEQDEEGVFKLKEEVRQAQLEEIKNPEKIQEAREELDKSYEENDIIPSSKFQAEREKRKLAKFHATGDKEEYLLGDIKAEARKKSEEEEDKLREALTEFKSTGNFDEDVKEFFTITNRENFISEDRQKTVDNFHEVMKALLQIKNDTELSQRLKEKVGFEMEVMQGIIEMAMNGKVWTPEERAEHKKFTEKFLERNQEKKDKK
ncbi:MAG: hypothetical protein EXS48_03430 [Candidatus Staskawiczbacteria bacterium]|nr:hypothetical protein [Candidatus Staskawiczbacteria bacterium]